MDVFWMLGFTGEKEMCHVPFVYQHSREDDKSWLINLRNECRVW